jgi:hypothetical protein
LGLLRGQRDSPLSFLLPLSNSSLHASLVPAQESRCHTEIASAILRGPLLDWPPHRSVLPARRKPYDPPQTPFYHYPLQSGLMTISLPPIPSDHYPFGSGELRLTVHQRTIRPIFYTNKTKLHLKWERVFGILSIGTNVRNKVVNTWITLFISRIWSSSFRP